MRLVEYNDVTYLRDCFCRSAITGWVELDDDDDEDWDDDVYHFVSYVFYWLCIYFSNTCSTRCIKYMHIHVFYALNARSLHPDRSKNSLNSVLDLIGCLKVAQAYHTRDLFRLLCLIGTQIINPVLASTGIDRLDSMGYAYKVHIILSALTSLLFTIHENPAIYIRMCRN